MKKILYGTLLALSLTACQHQKPAPVSDNRDKFFNEKLSLIVSDNDSTLFSPAKECRDGKFTLQAGDSLGTVARLCGTTVSELATRNNLSQPYHLKTGQIILLPESSIALSTPAGKPYVSSFSDEYRNPNAAKQKASSQEDEIQSPRSPEVAAEPLKDLTPTTVGTSPSPVPGNAQTKAAQPLLSKDLPTSLPDSTTKEAVKDIAEKAAPLPAIAAANPIPTPEEKPVETLKPSGNGKGFMWPLKGKVVDNFGSQKDGQTNDGINIEAERGASVFAAKSGTVVYTGSALKGYGNMVILRHEGGWLTAYSHLQSASVKTAQKIQQGDVIGYVGSTGYVATPQLHFVIRQGKEAVDPLKHLDQ